jgi:hypothetical protein
MGQTCDAFRDRRLAQRERIVASPETRGMHVRNTNWYRCDHIIITIIKRFINKLEILQGRTHANSSTLIGCSCYGSGGFLSWMGIDMGSVEVRSSLSSLSHHHTNTT